MAIGFNCPNCNQRLSVGSESAGKQAKCPNCSTVSVIPIVEITPVEEPIQAASIVFCPRCGEKNDDNDYRCTSCSQPLHEPLQPVHANTSDGTLGGLIPYKNSSALAAYYLAVFSLMPCLGLPLAFAALIFGIKGLNYAKIHPEAKGQVHAWIGVVLGSLCIVYGLFLVIGTIALVMNP